MENEMKNDVEKVFNVPFYLVEEIVRYYESGKSDRVWQQLYTNIKMAKSNNRFTEAECNCLLSLCKEGYDFCNK